MEGGIMVMTIVFCAVSWIVATLILRRRGATWPRAVVAPPVWALRMILRLIGTVFRAVIILVGAIAFANAFTN